MGCVYDQYLEGMHDEDIRGGVHGEQAAGRGQGHFVVRPYTALSLQQGGFGIAVLTQVQHALARSSSYCSACTSHTSMCWMGVISSGSRWTYV